MRRSAQSILEYVVIAAAIALAAIFVEAIMGGALVGIGDKLVNLMRSF